MGRDVSVWWDTKSGLIYASPLNEGPRPRDIIRSEGERSIFIFDEQCQFQSLRDVGLPCGSALNLKVSAQRQCSLRLSGMLASFITRAIEGTTPSC